MVLYYLWYRSLLDVERCEILDLCMIREGTYLPPGLHTSVALSFVEWQTLALWVIY
jgi:hypothetical protein